MRRSQVGFACTRRGSVVAAAFGAAAIVAAAASLPAAAQQPAGAPPAERAKQEVLRAPGIEPLAGAPGRAVNTSMCIGCHGIPGYKNAFPSVYSVPLIAGQPAKYIEAALHAYRRGERSHPTMQAIARGLTEEEIVALAQYYGTPNAGAPGAGGTR